MKQNSSMKQNRIEVTGDGMTVEFLKPFAYRAHTVRVRNHIILPSPPSSVTPEKTIYIYQPPTGTDMEECNTDTDDTDVFCRVYAYVRTYVRTRI